MSADSTEFDDGPPTDPFEAELVAYLDGELDGSALRRVEARLAADPAARARAAELKKAYDLLDFLPKPEPSPNFTTRTLEKLPAVRPAGASGGGTNSGPRPATPPAPAAVSTSMPVVLPEGPSRRPRLLLRVAGLLAAVAGFGALGYAAATAARPHLFANSAAPRDPGADEAKPEPDPRVIDRLPLLAVADDLHFVQELAKPELFGDEPAVSFDPTLKLPAADVSDPPGPKEREALVKAFRSLPASRQAEIVKLEADLQAREPRERDRLLRSLEAYAVWLARLPDAERRGVLAAATPSLRLGVVHDLREGQWLAALPAPVRKRVDALPGPKEKAEFIAQLKDDEAGRRDRWLFARSHAELFAANRSPWPFDDEARRKEVVDFAHAVFRVDDPKRCRLPADQLFEYRRTYELARREGAWAWYGLTVYELMKLHPYYPEPAEPKGLIVEPNDLPDPFVRLVVRKGGGSRLKPHTFGRWPEFPLGVLAEVPAPKAVANLPALGPARVEEFKEPVRQFAADLFPKLTADERRELRGLEGRWPEYPRAFVRLAAKYDLAVPGVTLPFSPKRWDATYGARPGRPAEPRAP